VMSSDDRRGYRPTGRDLLSVEDAARYARRLDALLDDERLDAVAREAFESMLLADRNGLGLRALTRKQRAFVDDVFERLGLDDGAENLFTRGAVPVGRPVELAVGPLPKAPPGGVRRTW